MITQLETLHDRLDTGLERMLGELRGMTEEQRRFKPGDEAWSAAQVACHLLLAQSGIVDSMEKKRGTKARGRTLFENCRNQAVRLVLWSGIRVRNPAPSAMPDPEITFDELEPDWATERTRLRGLLESMDASSLGDAGFKHPIAGPLTVAETVTFLATHVEHHLRQLRRIRGQEGFPG